MESIEELRIINLEAENVKRLIAVNIDFKGNLVQIASEENGEGKSTALDCIWWALEGAKNIQDKPIRKGEKEAHIRLTLGNKEVKMIVTREFRLNKKGETTTKLIISNPDGSDYPLSGGAQELLDTFLGALTFDPLKFSTMDSKDQFETLRAFVPNIDFRAIAMANSKDYDERKDINKEAKAAQTKAEAIVPQDIDDWKIVNEEELIQQLEKASTFNSDIETRKNNRIKLAQEASDKFDKATQVHEEAKAKIKEFEFQIQQIKIQSEAISEGLLKESQEIKEKLAALKPLPELIDIKSVSEQLTKAKEINGRIKMRDDKALYQDEAEKLQNKSDEITKRMEKREQEKRDAISKAKIPVTNLSFGDDCVLLDGQPFEQASEAQRIIASTELAIAQNPLLKIIIIKQGSLLSENSKKIVLDICKKKGFLVIMETVGTSSKVGNMVIIENGRVKQEIKPQIEESL